MTAILYTLHTRTANAWIKLFYFSALGSAIVEFFAGKALGTLCFVFSLPDYLDALFNWSEKQSHILTGGGALMSATEEGVHFSETELPHYHLRNASWDAILAEWIEDDRRSCLISGCWYRPLFCGGWVESTEIDTEVFNLQTPSIFIDMRFPTLRPSETLKLKSSLEECTSEELRILSRQHCFAGYSLISKEDSVSFFTRHHIIDWNYHPRFPRLRPNKWWVDVKSDGTSFKEYSFARDIFNVPLYMERWQRRLGDSQGQYYLALTRVRGSNQNYGIFVIVGNWFAVALDRNYDFVPGFEYYSGTGGCSNLVDAAVDSCKNSNAIALLDLQGAVGEVWPSQPGVQKWTIQRSTHPWREGEQLIKPSEFNLIFNANDFVSMIWKDETWTVVENSFDSENLSLLFESSVNQRTKL